MAWFHSFFGTHTDTEVKHEGTLLDVIAYLASLASNPQDIDPILDTMRVVSSRLKPGEVLSHSDEIELGKVYKDIEHYLTEKDPLRTFNTDEIHRRVQARFPKFNLK